MFLSDPAAGHKRDPASGPGRARGEKAPSRISRILRFFRALRNALRGGGFQI